jgi:hypothetical protein
VKLFSIYQDANQQWYRLSDAPEFVITPQPSGLISSWHDSTLDSAHEIVILNE